MNLEWLRAVPPAPSTFLSGRVSCPRVPSPSLISDHTPSLVESCALPQESLELNRPNGSQARLWDLAHLEQVLQGQRAPPGNVTGSGEAQP